MYKNQWFSDLYSLTEYLNRKDIKREDILYIGISPGISGGYVLLFYKSEEG